MNYFGIFDRVKSKSLIQETNPVLPNANDRLHNRKILGIIFIYLGVACNERNRINMTTLSISMCYMCIFSAALR